MLVDVLIFGAFLWSINLSWDHAPSAWYLDQATLAMAFAGVGAAAFGFLFIAIRCPICKNNVGWQVISTEGVSNWFKALMTLDRCPFC